ncbi:MAG: hypothetical protein IT244_11515 [Bacteroidia bacterium]|nr:hypothetical protein [Bacteroidia bacterium]
MEDGTIKVKQWKSEGMGWETIETLLEEHGYSPRQAEDAIQLVKKEIRAKHRSLGMLLLGIGSILCLFSMMFSLLVGPNTFVLYGLTMIGVTIAFAGLVYVMG